MDQPKVLKKPSLHSKVMEALENNTKSKGISLRGIKRYIIENYPEMAENFSQVRLRTAVRKGLEAESIKQKSPETGLSGFFILNKAKVKSQKAMTEKDKKPKSSLQKRDTSTTAKTKSKAAEKTSAVSKAKSKSVSKNDKSTTAKTKPKTTSTKPKATSTKPKATSTKLKTAAAAAAPKGTPKRPLTPRPTNLKAASSSRKGSGCAATPKISKADKAGKKSRKSSVKKLLK